MRGRWMLIGLAGMVLAGAADAVAQTGTRVVAARDTMTLRSCGATTCEVVAELPRGHVVEVLKTEGRWHQVVVALDGRRMTTGWVETTSVAIAPAGSARGASVSAGPPREAAAAATDDGDCLACMANRTATADEWTQALAITSGMKASTVPAPPSTSSLTPEAARARDLSARVEAVRRDGRSTVERMRDDLEEQYGPELRRLGLATATLDPELQSYMRTCYDKYVPVASIVPPTTETAASNRPTRARATVFDMWRGRPFFAWKEAWTSATPVFINTESMALCEGLWASVSERAAAVKAGVEQIETAARFADIYPGVVRDALAAHGLTEPTAR